MKLKRENARDLADCNVGYDARGFDPPLPFVVVENRDHDEKRWNMVMELVIGDENGCLFRAFYERGLTENQQGTDPFEYGGDANDEIEFEEVRRRVVEAYAYEGV